MASVAAGLAVATHALAADKPLKLEEFSGYWSGIGVVTWTNGNTEQLKCVATYKSALQDVRQNLRCASAGYSISSAADLKVAGGDISGTWEEKTYSANGLITGKTTDAGMILAIKGPTFTAEMNVSHTACKQTILITPTGVDVSKISINLGKC